jgi:flagellar hook-associated protein 2
MPIINFSGLASGIDSNALIDATSEATRKQRVEPNTKKVTELEETNATLEELKTKFDALKTLARDFSTLNGGALAKLAQSSNETAATASASNAASNGTYSVTVTQLAKNATFSFNDRFTSSSAVIDADINNGDSAANRTVSVSIGTGTNMDTVNIVLTNTSTLSDFVASFNNATTLAQASVVNVGTSSSPSYALMISSNNEGTEQGEISVSVGPSVTTAGAFTASTTSQATNAQFTVSGISGTITRSSNSVADVIQGLTMTLRAVGTSTITISDDADASVGKIEEFVDAYNEIVSFITDNNQITREEDGAEVTNIFGSLSSTRVDDNALQSLRSAISGSTYSSGTQVRIFADLGITTERDGSLKFDSTVFKDAISNEPSSVNRVLMNFGDTVSLTGGTIDQYIRFNGLFDSSVNGNKDLVRNLNEQIAQAEASILKTEDLLRQRFARLESTIGRLQQQQSALTSSLAGLGG